MNEKEFNYRLGRLTVKTSMSAPEKMAKETATTHALILILGSFRYSCAAGFHLDADGLTCHDINECQANNGKCSQKCINTQGDHSCSCFEGFVSLVRILFFFSLAYFSFYRVICDIPWRQLIHHTRSSYLTHKMQTVFFSGGVGLFFVSKLFVVRLFFYCPLFFFLFLFCIILFFSLRASRTCIKFDCTKWNMVSLSLSLSLLYSMVLTFSLLSIDECFDEINQCDSLANCHNTPGNHSYQCPDDYSSLWKDCIGEAGVYT